MQLRVDDEVMQSDTTTDLLFDPVALVQYVSTKVRLNPGDIIATGTPGGVSHVRNPKRYLVDDALGWAEQGAKLVREGVAGLDEPAFSAASGLRGWSRRHVVAHLAANADAVGNLVHWAATGERTPMYSSPPRSGPPTW